MIDSKVWEEYQRIIKDNHYSSITKIYCLFCVNESLTWLEIQDTTPDNTKIEIAQAVYDTWIKNDIELTRISDTICEHWEEYQNNDNFDINDYI